MLRLKSLFEMQVHAVSYRPIRREVHYFTGSIGKVIAQSPNIYCYFYNVESVYNVTHCVRAI